MNDSRNRNWLARLAAPGADQEEALSELRSILMDRVHRAFRTNSRVDDAFVEDVVQDGLVSVLNSLDRFQGRSQFTTWATTITIRLAITELRRRRWKDISLDALLESQASIDRAEAASTVEADVGRAHIIEVMHQVIREQLTERQRTVLQAELQGMPQEEIGRRIGSNRNAIYKLVHDARKRLKKGMVQAGFTSDDLAFIKAVSQ